MLSAITNGEKLPARPGVEHTHRPFDVQVAMLGGQSVALKFLFGEPTSIGVPRPPVQPLIVRAALTVSVSDCSRRYVGAHYRQSQLRLNKFAAAFPSLSETRCPTVDFGRSHHR